MQVDVIDKIDLAAAVITLSVEFDMTYLAVTDPAGGLSTGTSTATIYCGIVSGSRSASHS